MAKSLAELRVTAQQVSDTVPAAELDLVAGILHPLQARLLAESEELCLAEPQEWVEQLYARVGNTLSQLLHPRQAVNATAHAQSVHESLCTQLNTSLLTDTPYQSGHPSDELS